MAKKPDAARGKTTRKGRVKKMFEKLKQTAKGKKTLGMSPGAMGGRTKPKLGPASLKPGKLRDVLQRKQGDALRRQQQTKNIRQGLKPMLGAVKNTIKGAGASGTGLTAQAMKLAKQLKTSGRLSVDDIMRAKKMMMGRKGK
jgi:hypothetical protein